MHLEKMSNIMYMDLLTCHVIKRREKIVNIHWCSGKSKVNKNFIFVCSLSECAVVDQSEQDEDIFSDSPTDVTDSDEDFTPNKTATPKQKVKHATKSQIPQNENVSTNKLQRILMLICLI